MSTDLLTADPVAKNEGSDDVWQSCVNVSDIFFKSLEFGRIRGIVMIAVNSASEGELIPLAQELTKRDILVVIAGDAAAEVETAERLDPSMFEQADTGLLDLCDFIGIQPVVYMDRCETCPNMLKFFSQLADLAGKEVGHLPLTAMVMPSGLAATPTLEPICGTVFGAAEDAMKSADRLEDAIHEKRMNLDWCDRLHCDVVGYS